MLFINTLILFICFISFSSLFFIYSISSILLLLNGQLSSSGIFFFNSLLSLPVSGIIVISFFNFAALLFFWIILPIKNFLKNSPISFLIFLSLLVLCPPSSNIFIFFSLPAYLLNISIECFTLINSSFFVCIKRAGWKVFSAASIGFNFSISNPFLSKIVLPIIFSIPTIRKLGKVICCKTNSVASLIKSAKGESKHIAFILLFLWAYIIVVAAPIDLPHIPIFPTPSIFSTKLIIFSKSLLSWYPNEIYFPSDKPHPAKSKTNKFILFFNKVSHICNPSIRDDELPWRYKTTGIIIYGRYCFKGSIKEHFSKWPCVDSIE